MNRFWDMLPRAIRFKWKTTVQPTLGRFHRASDQQTDINDDPLLSPAVTSDSQQLETQKINSLTTYVPKLFTSTHKQSWEQDPNFCRWPFSLSQTFGVIGWGTMLAIGVQFNKYRWKLKNNSSNSECSWLEYVAYALPVTRSSILDFDQKRSHNSFTEFKPEESPQKKPEPADTLGDKLVNVVEKCVAIGQNIEGIKAANGGDYQAAVEHWKKSSNLGHSKSNFNLGLCYETGRGVTKDLTKAMKYYQVAADQDHCHAMYNLALLHLNSHNCTKNTHFIMAINLLERAAKLGLPQAQTHLGVFYAEGEQNNFSKAVEMFTAAAQQQDTEALYYLGACFEAGLGVDQNESKAAEFFIKAANSGHPEAQYCLANYYEQGLGGLPRDEKLAKELYLKSAKAGNENAQQRLQEILHEDSNKTAKVLKMSSSMPVLNSIEKVSQVATILTSSFSSVLTNSVMALKASYNNNNNRPPDSKVEFYLPENINGIEEQLDNHLQYMPHCCTKKDTLLPSIPNEVLCS